MRRSTHRWCGYLSVFLELSLYSANSASHTRFALRHRTTAKNHIIYISKIYYMPIH